MVEWKELGELCSIERGERVTKKQTSTSGTYPVISGGVTPMGYMEKFNRLPNTITIAQYGTAGHVAWQHDKFWANDVCYSIFPNESIANRYLYYVFKDKQGEIDAMVNKDATPYHLPKERLRTLLIPLPSIEEQERIVGIFDTLISNIDNLESQLAQRQKQSEYYRNQLLTFE